MAALSPTLLTAVVAGAVSGLPSTTITVARGGDLLASTRAAGSLLGKPTVVRGLVAHSAISLFWATVLARLLPARRTVAWGAAAGLGIAAFDLGVVARRYPRIASLPRLPQWLDHVAFGAVAGAVLSRVRGTP